MRPHHPGWSQSDQLVVRRQVRQLGDWDLHHRESRRELRHHETSALSSEKYDPSPPRELTDRFGVVLQGFLHTDGHHHLVLEEARGDEASVLVRYRLLVKKEAHIDASVIEAMAARQVRPVPKLGARSTADTPYGTGLSSTTKKGAAPIVVGAAPNPLKLSTNATGRSW